MGGGGGGREGEGEYGTHSAHCKGSLDALGNSSLVASAIHHLWVLNGATGGGPVQ